MPDGQLVGRFVLQLDELVNSASSDTERRVAVSGPQPRAALTRTRARSYKPGKLGGSCFTACLTDGVRHCVAFEYTPVAWLVSQTPPGSKLALTHPYVKLGQLLLTPTCAQLLGGSCSRLAAARARALAAWDAPLDAAAMAAAAVRRAAQHGVPPPREGWAASSRAAAAAAAAWAGDAAPVPAPALAPVNAPFPAPAPAPLGPPAHAPPPPPAPARVAPATASARPPYAVGAAGTPFAARSGLTPQQPDVVVIEDSPAPRSQSAGPGREIGGVDGCARPGGGGARALLSEPFTYIATLLALVAAPGAVLPITGVVRGFVQNNPSAPARLLLDPDYQICVELDDGSACVHCLVDPAALERRLGPSAALRAVRDGGSEQARAEARARVEAFTTDLHRMLGWCRLELRGGGQPPLLLSLPSASVEDSGLTDASAARALLARLRANARRPAGSRLVRPLRPLD
jgi:hypothetical protein